MQDGAIDERAEVRREEEILGEEGRGSAVRAREDG